MSGLSGKRDREIFVATCDGNTAAVTRLDSDTAACVRRCMGCAAVAPARRRCNICSCFKRNRRPACAFRFPDFVTGGCSRDRRSY